ncbi:MAG: glycosyltransferase family 2 protein [Parvularculaceae bacterium]
MAPKRVIDRVGVMDDGYFLYFEEVDLMKRVRAAGYQVWHVAESCVVHLGGQSTGVDIANRPAPTPDFWFRSRSKFFRDQYGKGGLLAANILFLAGDVIYRIHRLLMLKPIVNPPHLWRDYFTHGFATARERK